jgi:hypothetical protein
VYWPLEVHKIEFRNHVLFIIPQTDDTLPAVAVNLGAGGDFDAGQILISHFLSSLSWVTGQGVVAENWSGGSQCNPLRDKGHQRFRAINEDFSHPYLPDPQDHKTRLALAFYREGLSLNHVAYQCLSFFKILNIFLDTGGKQVAWISNTAVLLSDHRARKRIAELGATDIGVYLYGSGRCAVAHAGGNPTIDPEDPKDLRRLRQDLPLVKALAEFAIEHEFGVKSHDTVWREHLYELAGFKPIFREDHIAEITAQGTLPKEQWPVLPSLSVRLTGQEPYAPLEKMTAEILGIEDGAAIVLCKSVDALVALRMALEFRKERLTFNFPDDPMSGDDGTAHAIRQAVEAKEFWLDYFLNGALEVWDADRDVLLGRCNPYIPTNVDMTRTIKSHQRRMDQMQLLAAERTWLEASSAGSHSFDIFQSADWAKFLAPRDFPLSAFLDTLKAYLKR